MIFGFPNVGRSGLANMLLPWARCEVFCKTKKLPMLAPQWAQPKLGPLLRREKDKRFYMGLFKNDGYINGPLKWFLLASAVKISEAEVSNNNGEFHDGLKNKNSIVVFKGLGRYFTDLAGQAGFLHERLKGILSDSCRERLVDAPADAFVAVHIRRGDKPMLPFGTEPPKNTMHWAIATEWYVSCIRQVQEAMGGEMPVIIFTDAAASEIKSILELPNVHLAEPNSAIVDILLMAKARVLITSASSTFSMWASFLGGMPSVWFPSNWREKTNWTNPELEFYTDLKGNLPASFAGRFCSVNQ